MAPDPLKIWNAIRAVPKLCGRLGEKQQQVVSPFLLSDMTRGLHGLIAAPQAAIPTPDHHFPQNENLLMQYLCDDFYRRLLGDGLHHVFVDAGRLSDTEYGGGIVLSDGYFKLVSYTGTRLSGYANNNPVLYELKVIVAGMLWLSTNHPEVHRVRLHSDCNRALDIIRRGKLRNSSTPQAPEFYTCLSQFQNLIQKFDAFELEWLPRWQNKAAHHAVYTVNADSPLKKSPHLKVLEHFQKMELPEWLRAAYWA